MIRCDGGPYDYSDCRRDYFVVRHRRTRRVAQGEPLTGMTVTELMALLEGCHRLSEVRLAVRGNDGLPVEAAIVGITSSNRLPPARHVPGQGDLKPDVVWVLSGEPSGSVAADHWKPEYRREE